MHVFGGLVHGSTHSEGKSVESDAVKEEHGQTACEEGPIPRAAQNRIERLGSVFVFHAPSAQQLICYTSTEVRTIQTEIGDS